MEKGPRTEGRFLLFFPSGEKLRYGSIIYVDPCRARGSWTWIFSTRPKPFPEAVDVKE